LLKKRGKAIFLWNNLDYEHVPQLDFQELKSEFLMTLKEPLLPIPTLRREAFVFPTILQDIYGNSFFPPDSFGFPLIFPALDGLKQNLDQLSDNFSDPAQTFQLSIARWLIRSKKEPKYFKQISNSSLSTSYSCELGSNILVSLIVTIKKTIKAHCSAVSGFLNTYIENFAFLNAYCVMVNHK